MLKKLLLLLFIPLGILSAQVTIKTVKEFTVGPKIEAAQGVNMCATSDLLYFTSNNNSSTEGEELWVTDGTANGARLVKNISDSYKSSYPRWFKPALGKVLFVADVFGTTSTRSKLFITDGTEAGTIALCDLSYNYPASESVINSIYYGKEMNGKYYFSAETDTEEAELWVTDGTLAGTKMLKDINATTNFASFPKNFEVLDNKLYFTAKTAEYGEELWVSDGTEAGTVLVKDIYVGNKGYVTGELIAYKGKLYFAAADKDSGKSIELWMSDGTAAGTVLFKDINPDYRDANPANFFVFDNKLYFKATHYQTGSELWVSDGTSEGTVLVQDLNTGTASSNPASFIAMGNTLFFLAKDATNGVELRKLNAASQTIELVKDIYPGTMDGVAGNFYPDSFHKTLGRVAYGNQLIFIARDNTNNYYQNWITDGTSAGTQKLFYNANGMAGSMVAGYTVFKSEVYFWGYNYGKYILYKISGLVSGVENVKSAKSVYSIYLNSANKTLRISNDNTDKNLAIKITDINGRLLLNDNNYQNNTSLDISNLKQGVYIVACKANNSTEFLKFIVN